jgi:hypothetical protein
MRCYVHPDREAVGTCKICHRGVCMECGADRGQGLFCVARHRDRVDLLATAASALDVGANTRLAAPFVLGAVGLVAIALALKYDELMSLPGLVGGVFLVLAAVTWVRSRGGGGQRVDPPEDPRARSQPGAD